MNNTAHNYNLEIEHLSKGTSVLVSGAETTVGAHLCASLLELGCNVIAVDNVIWQSLKNLRPLFSNPNFSYLKLDFKSEDLRLENDVDYIFCLTFLRSKDFALDDLLSGSLGVTKLLELARKNDAKFLLATKLADQNNNLLEDAHHVSFGSMDKHASTSLLQIQKHAESLVVGYFQKTRLNARIIRLKDVYGPGMDFDEQDIISKFFSHAQTDKVLNIEGDGLVALCPTFVTDAVKGILMAMFGEETKGFIYNLFNPESTNVLTFARELESQLGLESKINFLPENKSGVAWSTKLKNSAVELSWQPEVSMKEGISKTLESFQKLSSIEWSSPRFVVNGSDTSKNQKFKAKLLRIGKPSIKNFPSFKKIKLRTLVVVVTLFVILLGACAPGVFLYKSGKNIQKNIQTFSKLTSEEKLRIAPELISQTSTDLETVDKFLPLYMPIFLILGKNDSFMESQKEIRLAKTGVEAVNSLLSLIKDASRTFDSVFKSDSEGGISLKIQSIKKELDESDAKLSYVQSQLPGLNLKQSLWSSWISQEKIDQAIINFKAGRSLVSRARELVTVLPDVLGLSGKRSYLLLFANNMELRPAGGFIGSYGLLSFDNGKMIELKIEDVYSADGQLTGHVEPPLPIRKYLEQPHWYLRDSNWSPDFNVSAQKAAWFLDKEIGRKVDGVFVVDLNGIGDLIRAVGSVNLPDYQETITSVNLFEKATKYSQENFFPGSTQKKDFLGSLSRRLLDKLLTEGSKNSLPLFTSLLSSLEQKHVAFYFYDEATQNLISKFNWGGRVVGNLCEDENLCYQDYLMLVDANLGVNKANVGVAKQVNYESTLKKDAISKKIQITYQNNNPTESYQYGRYKNYLRVYQPLNTELLSLNIDGVDKKILSTDSASLKKEKEEGVVVNESVEGDKQSFGLLVDIPPGKKSTIEMSLSTNRVNIERLNDYILVLQKQLGAQNDDVYVNLVSQDKPILSYPTGSKKRESGVISELKLSSDQVLRYLLKK